MFTVKYYDAENAEDLSRIRIPSFKQQHGRSVYHEGIAHIRELSAAQAAGYL
jgi:hypothetical protein